MKNPLISIISPVYNVEKELPYSLDSVLAQTFKDFELICINDGSPDNSGKILDDYAKKDNRIKVFHQQNKGAGPARNKGLDEAKGKYIFFLDPDDLMHPQMLEILYSNITKGNFDFAYFKRNNIHNIKNVKHKKINQEKISTKVIENPFKSYFSKSESLKTGVKLKVMIWLYLYKKSYIGNYRFKDIKQGQDTLFSSVLIDKAKKGIFVDEHLYCYLEGRESSTLNNSVSKKKVDGKIKIIEEIYSYYGSDNKKLKMVVKKIFKGQVRFLMKFLEKSKNDKVLNDYIKKILLEKKKKGIIKYKYLRFAHKLTLLKLSIKDFFSK